MLRKIKNMLLSIFVCNKYIHSIMAIYWGIGIFENTDILMKIVFFILFLVSLGNIYVYSVKVVIDKDGNYIWKD